MKRGIATLLLLSLLLGTFAGTVWATEHEAGTEAEPVHEAWPETGPAYETWPKAEAIYKMRMEAEPASEGITPRSASFFSQEEIDDPQIWYAVPNHVVTLEPTPASTAYARLQAAIQAAPVNAVTHIFIPFHINIGNVNSGTMTIVGVRNGATVVLIGNHPTAENGQSVISDTHGGNSDTTPGGGGLTRAFRVRGDGTARSGLVFRNIILQTAPQAAASTPDVAPAPLPLAQQTNNARGGGVTLESGAVAGITGAGGGGHLILCRGGVIRNSSTDNNGPVDIQTDGRFTMMPGSEMHTNAAANSGGAVHVNTRGIFTMHGGVLRNNVARGERVDAGQATQRAVGGAVFIQNGGTFNMYDGEIFENQARLNEIAANPDATNALVTSSGGGVFVTGSASSFNMHGGTIRDNQAIRTRASFAITQDNRYLHRAGNGGGVYVTARATFNMRGGYIENNIATATGTAASSFSGGDALNLSNGGGVYLTGAGTRFHMQGGTIRNNQAVRTVNSVPTMTNGTMTVLAGNGGGVHVYDDAVFTMDDGDIYGNIATSTGADPADNTINLFLLANGGGVFVSGTAVLGAPDLARFFLNGGTIRDNHAVGAAAGVSTFSGNGGGVSVMSRAQLHMTGGVISRNTATDNNTTTSPSQGLRRGNGAGVYLGRGFFTQLSLNMTGGEIREHTTVTRHGVGVFMTGGRVEIGGTARIEDNHSPNNGGGIFVEDSGTLNISGGTINGNTAQQNGGGVFLRDAGIVLNMRSGSITNNIAHDGGGLFVPHTNLSNVTINPAAVFSGNTARNGLRIDTPLAVAQRPRIDPGTVSVSGLPVIDQNPAGSDNFATITPHAFTNYDINSTGPQFWRVTYAVGEGEGELAAQVGSNRFPVPSGSFIRNGAAVTFTADSAPPWVFDWWDVGTRTNETAEDGSDVPFDFTSDRTAASLLCIIGLHTHVNGNFFEVKTTALTVSKEVTGALGNKTLDFDFTIFLTDADGTPLPAGTQFNFTGNVLADSGATVPADGILTLRDGGSATFQLRHGQAITIEELPRNGSVQIIETVDLNFMTSFTDSEYADVTVLGNDTTLRPMAEDRTFAFTNERVAPPPTGLNLGNMGAALLLPALVLLSAAGAYTAYLVRRCRRCVC
ncbi:MAG: hypothetical protein FWE08_01085 [Oscillospiraceae bacterium]|nr:hypothetical protein [Oscillospiraceae bacterium]